MASDLEVLLVLPQDRVIVSTKGFCRVVIASNGETLEELVPLAEAHLLTAESIDNHFALEAIDYATGKPLALDNRGLSDSRRRRLQQLLDAPRACECDKARRCFALGRLLRKA